MSDGFDGGCDGVDVCSGSYDGSCSDDGCGDDDNDGRGGDDHNNEGDKKLR